MDLAIHEGDIPIPTPIQIPIPIKYVVDPSPNSPNTTGAVENHDTITCYRNAIPGGGVGGGGGGNEINEKGVGVEVGAVKYRECLKNHAASIGGNATDGCGEFMPSGEEGTVEALKCSACNCHRNFHRKEVEGESSLELLYQNRHQHGSFKRKKIVGKKGVLISGSNTDPFMYRNSGHNSLIPMPSPHHMIMPLGAMQTSDQSDEMEGVGAGVSRPMKKRFRTKFTQDQKDRMLSFAERSGWRLQKQEESVVQQFCQEIGVRRRVLKVWMHNNKHNLQAKKGASTINNQLS